jgi:hypothetical protein
VERVVPFFTPADLAKRFRKNADDCDRAAMNDIRDLSRQHLKKTAARYRALADEIDAGRGYATTPRERLNIASPRQPGPTQ